MVDGSWCKIGKSKSPKLRLKSMKTARPNLKLICFGRKVSEDHMRKKYRKYNVGGEWYKFPSIHVYRNVVCDIASDKQVKKFKMQWASENKKKKKDKAREDRYHDAQKSRPKYEDYVLDFGRFKGIKLIDMVNSEQRRFLRSCIKNSNNKQSYRIKAIFWWLNKLKEIDRIEELKNKEFANHA